MIKNFLNKIHARFMLKFLCLNNYNNFKYIDTYESPFERLRISLTGKLFASVCSCFKIVLFKCSKMELFIMTSSPIGKSNKLR